MHQEPVLTDIIDAACTRACAAIAPAWPLDRAIAVNPHWERIGRPVREVAARMAVLAGIAVYPPRARIREFWTEGRIRHQHLEFAIAHVQARSDAQVDAPTCVDALHQPVHAARLPTLIAVLEQSSARPSHLPWQQAITHQISQTCAAYFDRSQALWKSRHPHGLYAFWAETVRHDHGIGVLMGLPQLHRAVSRLPATSEQAEVLALQRFTLADSMLADYLEALLLDIQGWASWCAYVDRHLETGETPTLRDLLAIVLAWSAMLIDSVGVPATDRAVAELVQVWARAPQRIRDAAREFLIDEIWQVALEYGYQADLAQRLQSASRSAMPPTTAAEVQAVFCIDVRSEPMRRALENIWPGLETIGYAGFFGMPIAYAPSATPMMRPQLPGLMAPAWIATDAFTVDRQGNVDPAASAALTRRATRARARHAANHDTLGAWSRWPAAAFTFVETAGLGYLFGLATHLVPGLRRDRELDTAGLPRHACRHRRPILQGVDLATQVELAANACRGMGLDQRLAPLVLIVGHSSQSSNNAHAAALDCGACCGQSGEINARLLVGLLNDTEVRSGLRARGLHIPDSTTFVAALHNTTTDQVQLFDPALIPAHQHKRWSRLQQVLEHASDQVRRERAGALGLNPKAARRALYAAVRKRSADAAQTRPEWGLVGNASMVIAPRWRTRGAALQGRCFLHEYSPGQDHDGKVLESLMTGPLVVAHWINWQYHASTCDPQRLGSGSKLLHNVVGGRIGVFEGNGGDLRVGLSLQSLHDGSRWMHEPLRLSVCIDAPIARIETIIARHPAVRQLVDHGWLHLFQLDDDGGCRRRSDAGVWTTDAAFASRVPNPSIDKVQG